MTDRKTIYIFDCTSLAIPFSANTQSKADHLSPHRWCSDRYPVDLLIQGTSVKMNSEVLCHLCFLILLGFFGVGAVRVPVSAIKGDSVTLHTDDTTNQHKDIKWYFGDTRIAEIRGDLSFVCTDVQCKDGDERFRDRLKLDHQTGSLTIKNISTTDTGLYHLEIINSGSDSDKTFNVTVNGVSAPEDHQKKRNPVKEGESDSGLSSAAVAGICVGVVLLVVAAAAVGVIYYRKHHQAGQCVTGTGTRTPHSNQENGVTYSSVKHADNGSAPVPNGHESADTNEQ